MEIWMTRDQRGLLLSEEYSTPDEIEGDLASLEIYPLFNPRQQVRVELSGYWEEIKQLLADIQFLADQVRNTEFDKGSEKDLAICRLQENKMIKQ